MNNKNTEELMKDTTFEKIKPYIYLYPLPLDIFEAVKSSCPSFETCGIGWIFAVEEAEEEEDLPDPKFINNELAKKWIPEPEKDIVEELYELSVLNILHRVEHINVTTLYDDDNDEISVPIFQIYLDDIQAISPYSVSLMLCNPILESLHETIGDFYLIPRYRSRFFVISSSALKESGRTAQEALFKMLVRYKYHRLPPKCTLSDSILFADEEELRLYS